MIPNFDQIVECEKRVLEFYQWDIKFFLPIHFIRCFLANGIIFVNEFDEETDKSNGENKTTFANVAAILATEALSTVDIIASRSSVHSRKEDPSTIAASIIYYARKNVFTSKKYDTLPKVQNIWPKELILLTRCSEA